MLRYFILLFFLPALMEVNARACQSLEQAIEFSEAEYDCGNYALAACDFQRAWLFSENSQKAGLEQRIADCFFNLNEYDLAVRFYRSALQRTGDGSTRNDLLLDITTCHIHAREFFNALTTIDSLNVGDDGALAEKKWFLSGICNWGINRYDEAFFCFRESVPIENRAAREKITELKSDFFAIRYPNPRLAGWLSIIPGTGQFYCFEFGPGLNSLLLNGSLLLAGYCSIVVLKNNVLLLNLLPWIQRFYAGGIVQAKGYAENKLRIKRNRIYQGIIEVIKETQTIYK
jgi:tetratricopeptide (TPR) repeat protein